MKYPQLWRSPGLAITLLLAAIATPSAIGAAHTVRSGDTFTSIARKYKISVDTLQKANPRIKPGLIIKGQVLNLPGGPVPVVAAAKTGKAKPVTAPPAKTVPDKGTTATAKTTKPIPTAKPTRSREPQTEADEPVKRPSAITTYRVKSGETLTGLARRSGISVGELADMNGLERTELHEGQKLILPLSTAAPSRETRDRYRDREEEHTVDITPPARRPRQEEAAPVPRRPTPKANPPATQGTYYHVVKRGDTFSSIARQNNVSVASLAKANRNIDPTRLTVSQKLNVPAVQVASRQSTTDVIEDAPPARITSYRPVEPSKEDSPPAPPPAFNDAEETSDTSSSSSGIAYRITSSDTMESIAREFNTTPKQLSQMNKKSPWDRLTPGDFLFVPWPPAPRRD
jgi:LysM repeat protein